MNIFITLSLSLASIILACYELDALFGFILSALRYKKEKSTKNRSNFVFWEQKLLFLSGLLIFGIILVGYKNAIFIIFDTYILYLNLKGLFEKNKKNYFSISNIFIRIVLYVEMIIQRMNKNKHL